MKGKWLLILLFSLISGSGKCQYNDLGPGYQLTLLGNPGLTGSEGEGSLRLSYLNFYPGNRFNIHSVNVSYDGYFPVLHGGAGFYISDDNLNGIINNLRGGFSYAYHFQAGRDLFISAG